MPRYTRMIILLGLVQIGFFLADYLYRSPGDVRELYNGSLSLSQEYIDLGMVDAGKKAHISTQILNMTDAAIELRRPEASCGCISATLSSILLPRNGRVDLSFDVQMPFTPQHIERTVSVSPALGSGTRTVRVVADVVAAIWAVPNGIRLTLAEQGNTAGSIDIHVATGWNVSGVKTSTNRIRAFLSDQLTGIRRVAISVTDRSPGNGAIVVSARHDVDSKEKEIVIPISWAPRKGIVLIPSVVRIDGGGSFNREIVVLFPSHLSLADLSFEKAVPWIQITGHKLISPGRSCVMLCGQCEGDDCSLQGSQLLQIRLPNGSCSCLEYLLCDSP